jgi:hypothetical protein
MTEDIKRMLPCPKIVHGQQELTAEQQAFARHFAQVCIASMLSTTAVDEVEAEAHLRHAYRVAGIEPPAVRWFDSPISFVVDSMDKDILGNMDSMWDSVMDSMRDSVESNVRGSVGDNVWNNVWDSVMDSMWDSVIDNMWDSVRGIVIRSAEDIMGPNRWNSLLTYACNSVVAYYNAIWLAVCRFFHEAFEENHLLHFALFNEMVGGYQLGSKEAWLVRKPIRLERDDQGRLHSVSGMSLQYRDGWGFYAWHGVRVPEKLILHPDQFTKEDYWLWENKLEVQHALQERLALIASGKDKENGTHGHDMSLAQMRAKGDDQGE